MALELRLWGLGSSLGGGGGGYGRLGCDRSRVSEQHGGWAHDKGFTRQASVEIDRVQRRGTRVWNDQHYKPYNYGMENIHCIGSIKGSAAGDNAR